MGIRTLKRSSGCPDLEVLGLNSSSYMWMAAAHHHCQGPAKKGAPAQLCSLPRGLHKTLNADPHNAIPHIPPYPHSAAIFLPAVMFFL
jgi:hypothetical protein